MSPDTNDAADTAEVTREEHGALRWAAIAATLAIGWLVMPIGVGMLLGMLFAFVMQPAYIRLKPRIGSTAAAFGLVVGAGLALAGMVFGLGALFVTRGAELARRAIGLLGPDGSGGDILAWVGRQTSRFGISADELPRRARALAEGAAAKAAAEAQAFVGGIATALLGAFFAMLTMHFMLRRWESVTRQAQETFPLRPDYTRGLFAEFRRVGRTTLMGTIVTGLAQGLLATVGYWIGGVPEPLFFGAATAVASLVPAVGTLLVWVPIGIVMIVSGHAAGGIFVLAWGGLLVVAVSDYVIRPRLVGGEQEVPSLVTFAALFGGVEVFGLKGLIVGPVLMSLSIAVLRLYASETRQRRHIAPPPASETGV